MTKKEEILSLLTRHAAGQFRPGIRGLHHP